MLNPTNILGFYKNSKDLGNGVDKLFNEIFHNGKDYFGEVFVQDNNGRLWEIKIRHTGDRGRYLKIKSKSNGSKKVRATADGYKDYLRITPDEWEIFYRLAAEPNNQQLYNEAKKVLTRLF
jgi:hypothetical protein